MHILKHTEDLTEELELVAQFYNDNPTLEDAYDAFVDECQKNGFNPGLTEEQFAFAWSGIDAFIDVFTFLDQRTGQYLLGSNFTNA